MDADGQARCLNQSTSAVFQQNADDSLLVEVEVQPSQRKRNQGKSAQKSALIKSLNKKKQSVPNNVDSGLPGLAVQEQAPRGEPVGVLSATMPLKGGLAPSSIKERSMPRQGGQNAPGSDVPPGF